MAATMSTGQIQTLLARAGSQMKALGVGMDLAPVADLDGNPGPSSTDPDGQRSFSPDPGVASRYTVAYAAGLRQSGVIPVVKHFPGLGGATGNTDNGPASTPPLSSLRSAGLAPFRAAIDAGDAAIMVSNASVPGLTGSPASLSPAVVAGLLRNELGFDGLVLTDSVSAGAVTSAGYDVPKAAVAAIAAGDDMVLFGSTLTRQDVAKLTPDNVSTTLRLATSALVSAVGSGRLQSSRIDSAVMHIVNAERLDLCAA
jgi:beta-N-acetylhexosaminidase